MLEIEVAVARFDQFESRNYFNTGRLPSWRKCVGWLWIVLGSGAAYWLVVVGELHYKYLRTSIIILDAV